MRGLNKVMLIGHLGKDPELSYTPNGTAVCKFTIATDESYKGDDGNIVPKTEWHNITAWRKLGELCAQYLKKGSRVYLEGKIQTDSYEKDGKKSYFTKVVISEMLMLDSKGGGNATAPVGANSNGVETSSDVKSDDDLPF